jgi:hypothetical protein
VIVPPGAVDIWWTGDRDTARDDDIRPPDAGREREKTG